MRHTRLPALILLLVLCAFTGCDRTQARVVGKWKIVGDPSNAVWEFSRNGTVFAAGSTGRYSFGDNDRIKIQTPVATFVHQVEFKNERMIWKDPNGAKTELVRVP